MKKFAVLVLAGFLCVRMVFASGGLNVRREPNANSQPVYLLENREIVIVHEERDGWLLVSKNYFNSYPLGWVCADYVK